MDTHKYAEEQLATWAKVLLTSGYTVIEVHDLIDAAQDECREDAARKAFGNA